MHSPGPSGTFSLVSNLSTKHLLPIISFWSAQANEQLQIVRESHAATSKEVADAHRSAHRLHRLCHQLVHIPRI